MGSFIDKARIFFRSLLLGWVVLPLIGAVLLLLAQIFFDLSDLHFKIAAWVLGFFCLISPIYIARRLGRKGGAGKKKSAKKKTAKKVSAKKETAKSRPSKKYSTVPDRSSSVERGGPPLEWHGWKSRIRIKDHVIQDVLTYAAKGTPREDEPSCIDLKGKVGKPVHEEKGALGYWPSYARLSPDQKANYLQWLASERDSDLNEIGYAFIYFYGLERRLLVDGQDQVEIMSRVCRLLNRYTFSRSFNGYLCRFLAYAVARVGVDRLEEQSFQVIFEQSVDLRYEECLAVALAWFHRQNRALPVQWAKRIAERDPRSSRSVVLSRVPDEYDALFTRLYAETCGDGLVLKASKKAQRISYYPANAALAGSPITEFEIPNILAISSQFKKLVDIRSRCIADLKKLSRLALKKDEATTGEVYEALPAELQQEQEHPDLPLWQNLLEEKMADDGSVLVEISRLAAIRKIDVRDRLTKKQSENIVAAAQGMGLGVEPDARLTSRNYAWNQVVSLFRLDDDAALPDRATYAGPSLILELGIALAAADGKIDDEEVDHISRFLEGVFNLEPHLVRRLEALRTVLVSHPPGIRGIANRLKKILTEEHRKTVGEFIIGVAGSDGTVTREEMAMIKRLHKALDLPRSILDDFITEARAGADTTRPAEAQAPPALVLNPNRIRDIMIQTREVASILGKAMGALEPDEEEEGDRDGDGDPEISSLESRFPGLDSRYQAILSKLLTRPSWDQESFDHLVREHHLMPSGTISMVNEWAEEVLGDFIIEEDEEIIIHKSLLEES